MSGLVQLIKGAIRSQESLLRCCEFHWGREFLMGIIGDAPDFVKFPDWTDLTDLLSGCA